ncbi:MAG: AIR synthase related protein, partial [Acidimicrobiales bacterium]
MAEPPVPAGELEVLRAFRKMLPGGRPGEVYSGDDAAVLDPPPGGSQLLLTTDLVLEGVHFDLAIGTAADAAWKAVASNVSDIAAMGGRPLHA